MENSCARLPEVRKKCCHLIIGNGANAGDHLISDKTRSIILSNKSGDHVGASTAVALLLGQGHIEKKATNPTSHSYGNR